MNQTRRNLWIWLVGGLALLILGAVIAFFFFFKPGATTAKEIPFADALVMLNKERSQVTVVSADRDQVVLGEWDLSVAWMQSDRYGNGVYLLEEGEGDELIVHQLTFSPDMVELKEKYRFTYPLTETTQIKLDEDSFIFYEPSMKRFVSVNLEFFETKVLNLPAKTNLTTWTSTDDRLYYNDGNQLTVYHWTGEKVLAQLTFEDDILELFEKDNHLYVFNGFGTAKNYTSVFKLVPQTLAVKGLGKLDFTEVSVYPMSHLSQTVFFKGIQSRSKGVAVALFEPTVDLNQSTVLTDSILEQPFIFTAFDYLYTVNTNQEVEVYSQHTYRPIYTLKGGYSEVYPLWDKSVIKEIEVEHEEARLEAESYPH